MHESALALKAFDNLVKVPIIQYNDMTLAPILEHEATT